MAVEPPVEPPVSSEPTSPTRLGSMLLNSPVATMLVVMALVVLIGIVPVRYLATLAPKQSTVNTTPTPKPEPVDLPRETAPEPAPEPAVEPTRVAALKARDAAQEAARNARGRYRDEAGVPLEEIESFSTGQRWLGHAEELLDNDPVESKRVFEAATTAFAQVDAPPPDLGLGQVRADFARAVRTAQERYVLAGDRFDKCTNSIDLKGLEVQAQGMERKQDWNGARAIYASAIEKLNACRPSEPESLKKALQEAEYALNACIQRFKRAKQELDASAPFQEVRALLKSAEEAREAGRFVAATATLKEATEVLQGINPVKPAPAPAAKAEVPAPKSMPEAEPKRVPAASKSDSTGDAENMAAEAKVAINRAEAAARSARDRFARAERMAERNPGYSHATGVLQSARERMGRGEHKDAVALAVQATQLFEASAPEAWKNVEVNQFTPPATLP